MKTQLFLALALSVMAANTFANDGFDKTGTATFISQSATAQSGSTAVASDSADHATKEGAIAADGTDKTALGRIDS
ncbi:MULTISPECIES: hypothetical protein [unclassified Pseudomonas]|uniref:hypothetical protein n=1 Tax=unclassified Pseudomonas TaxID=196821 RepID=UPI002AC8E5E8|nr:MULTISPECIES: hypothetical protein [unclassified Pseudomonas]MEB0045099.1 hypothetical protein [Pseudomonas sp. Dout3]MEB0095889.1 hypothetical protein [Pseudomonas sp. DC1.2]WPX57757.1 hypothetical protein RHM68_19395 [Pseudomonas sp. DC1.2]